MERRRHFSPKTRLRFEQGRHSFDQVWRPFLRRRLSEAGKIHLLERMALLFRKTSRFSFRGRLSDDRETTLIKKVHLPRLRMSLPSERMTLPAHREPLFSIQKSTPEQPAPTFARREAPFRERGRHSFERATTEEERTTTKRVRKTTSHLQRRHTVRVGRRNGMGRARSWRGDATERRLAASVRAVPFMVEPGTKLARSVSSRVRVPAMARSNASSASLGPSPAPAGRADESSRRRSRSRSRRGRSGSSSARTRCRPREPVLAHALLGEFSVGDSCDWTSTESCSRCPVRSSACHVPNGS